MKNLKINLFRNIVFCTLSVSIISSCSLLKKNSAEVAVATQNETNKFVDTRDNQQYSIVKIGNQWWFSQNLNFTVENESSFYNNSSRNGEYFGKLYTFNAAQNACPAGWRLPSDDDWKTLEKSLGMEAEMADETEFRGVSQGALITPKGNSGFMALYGGWKDHEGNYLDMNQVAAFWTATPSNKNEAWARGLEKDNNQISRRTYGKTLGFSVRCVKE